MWKRVLYTIFLVCGIFLFPPIIFCIFVLLGVILFRNYFEVVGVIFLYEGTFTPVVSTFPFVGTAISLCLVFLVKAIRPFLRN